MGSIAQLARTQIEKELSGWGEPRCEMPGSEVSGAGICGEIFRRECSREMSGFHAGLHVSAAVIICASPVNTQTHTHTKRQLLTGYTISLPS